MYNGQHHTAADAAKVVTQMKFYIQGRGWVASSELSTVTTEDLDHVIAVETSLDTKANPMADLMLEDISKAHLEAKLKKRLRLKRKQTEKVSKLKYTGED